MAIRRLALILTTAAMLATTQLAATGRRPATGPRASAAVIGCSQSELTAALALGGSITLDCGPGPHTLLFTAPQVVTTTASIDGGGQVTASGQDITTLFVIQPGAALTLTHLTVTKGFANADGGAVRVSSGGALVIDGCTFTDNHTGDAWSGGAIVSHGALKISNSTFDHNSAGNGGAVNPRDESSSTDIRNTVFRQNHTTNATNGWGGAILVWVGAAVTVTNSQFIGNTAQSGDFSSSTIDRGGAVYVTPTSVLTVDDSEFAGNSAFFGGALYVDQNASLTVTGSNLHDNSIGVFDGTQGGGAIYNAGNLLVDTDQLHDNHADGAGGAIENVGSGSLLVVNSVLRHNSAGGGGAIEANGNTTVLTSTLADNTAQLYGGAIDAADRTDTSKGLTVRASTLSGNSAASEGGAIASEMRLALTNVTISGNTGPEAIDHYDRAIALTNVTLAQNAGTGLNLHGTPPLQLGIENTILSGPGDNCAGIAPTSLGHNLDSGHSCAFAASGDLVDTDPKLGALADNGGPTLTHALMAGSPAIDAAADCPPPDTDQRGAVRPAGVACDIGAFEGAVSPTTTTTLPPTCVREATFSSIQCRLPELLAAVDAAVTTPKLRRSLDTPLGKAAKKLDLAATAAGQGRKRRVKSLLASADTLLEKVGTVLRSKRAAAIPADTLADFRGRLDDLRVDVQALRQSVG